MSDTSGTIIEIHEIVNHLEAHEEVVEIIEVAGFGESTDRIRASLATEEGQLLASLAPASWAAIDPPASDGLVLTSDIEVPGMVKWAAHSATVGDHALDAHDSPTDITTGDATTSAHGLAPKAVAPLTGLMNVLGLLNGETAYSLKALFDNVNPAGLGTPAPGTQVIAARRDHVHSSLSGVISPVNNVKDPTFGAVGDGSTDDTAAIQAAIDALPDNGGIVFLPAGIYKITSTLTIGNGSTSAFSTKNGITFMGAGIGSTNFFGASYEGATIIQWSGSSGGTALKLSGVVEGCKLKDFAINGNQLATTLLDVQRAHLMTIENVVGYKWQGGYAVKIHNPGNTGYKGQGMVEQTWSHVHLRDPYGTGAHGIDIAPYETGFGNVCEATFISCSFARSASDSAIGLRLGYCDHITFVRTFLLRESGNTGIAIQVEPVTGYADWPMDICFIGSPILGGIKYVNTVAWTNTTWPALVFYPFYTADNQTVPPAYVGATALPVTMCSGYTDNGKNLWIPGWTAPTLLNSWANFGGTYSTAGYYRDGDNVVHLRGMVKNGTIGSGIFALPSGYRPSRDKIFATISNDGTNNLISRCEIDHSGNVIASTGGNTWFSLDGITFRAETAEV